MVKTIKVWEHPRPPLLDPPNFDLLKKTVVEYMDAVESVEQGGYVDEDFQHYIFEEAIKAFYGNDAWAFINERA